MSVVYRHRVRYHETDPQSFLFNARYLEIADVAMSEFLRGIGCPYPDIVEQGFDPSVVRTEITFARPAHFDDVIDVDVVCSRMGSSSYDIRFTMTRDDVAIAVIESVYVNVDVTLGKSRPVPPHVRAALTGE